MAQTVSHHPASVNYLVLQQLRDRTRTATLSKFLSKELAGVSPAVALKVLADVGASSKAADEWAHSDTSPKALTDAHITRLVQVLHRVTYFKAP